MVTMDGRQYRVRVKIKSLRRSFRIEEDDRSSMVKSGAYFRSIIGTYYDYAMEVEPDPAAPEEYDEFFEAISAPVESPLHHRALRPGHHDLRRHDQLRRGHPAGQNRRRHPLDRPDGHILGPEAPEEARMSTINKLVYGGHCPHRRRD